MHIQHVDARLVLDQRLTGKMHDQRNRPRVVRANSTSCMPQPNSGSITRSPGAVRESERSILNALFVPRLRNAAVGRDLQREAPADARNSRF